MYAHVLFIIHFSPVWQFFVRRQLLEKVHEATCHCKLIGGLWPFTVCSIDLDFNYLIAQENFLLPLAIRWDLSQLIFVTLLGIEDRCYLWYFQNKNVYQNSEGSIKSLDTCKFYLSELLADSCFFFSILENLKMLQCVCHIFPKICHSLFNMQHFLSNSKILLCSKHQHLQFWGRLLSQLQIYM